MSASVKNIQSLTITERLRTINHGIHGITQKLKI